MPHDLVAQALDALRRKDFTAARRAIADYGEISSYELSHYLIKGLAELAQEDWRAAQATFTEATEQFPDQDQLWFNRAIAEENLGALDDAIASYKHSLALKPDQAGAAGNLSNLYRRRGKLEDAERMAHRAYELGAPKAEALNILGLALGRQGKFAEAESVFLQALEARPGYADALLNRANLCADQLQFEKAWPFFAAARAASTNPVIRRDEGMARLLAGDYAGGWRLYEARLEIPGALRLQPKTPRWHGENPAGKKLLLLGEQGFGDTIMFCRYGRQLAEAGAELIWIVQPPLVRLLAGNVPGLVLGEGDPLPPHDMWLPLMSLPFALNKYSPAAAPAAPYLQAPALPILPHEDKPRIGLVLSGSPTHERDRERSIPRDMLQPLIEKTGAKFFEIPAGLAHLINDFADTAALLKQMDALVTVDTAPAHLAGALGVKTFLLLPYSPDWRWGIHGETTPWYGSLSLLRQASPGDWAPVLGSLAERLNRLELI